MEFVKQSVGVGKITNKRISKPHHAPSFAYAVYNRQALALLEQIQPYLRSHKAERSELAISDYLKLKAHNGKYSEQLRAARAQFEAEFLGITPRQAIAPENFITPRDRPC